ncbi:MAG: hypothetical protein JWN38_610 [Candidatus Saccharibacteria bacterium]|nr:hypothetical protein [Candidatus Saccharibacteria bacterium]
MQFIQTSDRSLGAAALRTRLTKELTDGLRVLWLVSGGSNIAISVAVMDSLPQELTSRLIIMLADERHGPVGHADSNATQLLAAGFDHKQAALVPVLVGDRSLEETRLSYDAEAREAYTESDVIIGQLGMGADGHIAGLLPGSSGLDSAEFVAAYQTKQYDRLTLTSHALKRLNVAYVFAFGEDKQPQLHRLQELTLPYSEQPAQILKELPEVYIFNDEIGEQI